MMILILIILMFRRRSETISQFTTPAGLGGLRARSLTQAGKAVMVIEMEEMVVKMEMDAKGW